MAISKGQLNVGRFILIFVLFTYSQPAKSQVVDTLIDVGTYKLHFKITKGKGTPILFESGGGLDANQWDTIAASLCRAIAPTMITYDREGFGKSGMDTTNYTILNEIKGLEIGLRKLGYANMPLILVCHSLGAFYNRVYASRHPQLIKGIVMLDPRIPCYTDMTFARRVAGTLDRKKVDPKDISLYYVLVNMEGNSDFARKAILKPRLPILDIMAENGPFDSAKDNERFKVDERRFVSHGANRKLLFAKGCDHNIPQSKPQLVIEQIVSFYKKYK